MAWAPHAVTMTGTGALTCSCPVSGSRVFSITKAGEKSPTCTLAAAGAGRVARFVSGVGESRLFHNEGGGKFTDVTAAAGVGGTESDWSTGAAWADYDNDGRLDLF